MHLVRSRRLVACLVALAVVSAVPQTAGAISRSRQRALEGSSYIVGQQRANGAICAFSCIGSTADAVVSLVAARTAFRDMKEAVAYLRRQVERGHVTGVGLGAKVAMAAEAGGANPRAFGGVNLVRAITDIEGGDGHYGDATVFDQALAMLALRGAGTEPSAAAVSWLEAAQCDDGGWQYDAPPSPSDDEHCFDASAPDPGDFFTSDSNTTGLAIQVLRTGTDVDEALAFLPTLRDGTAGWGYSQGYPTDINSTALVIQAYVAAGVSVPSGGFATLRTSQLDCGAWPYQPGGLANIGATIGAVLGILRRPLPVPPLAATSPVPSTEPCA
jgi:hypothetical protein